MAVVNKIKQIHEVRIDKLVLLAKGDGEKSDQDVARWIIATSPYWRAEGYKRIIEEMGK